ALLTAAKSFSRRLDRSWARAIGAHETSVASGPLPVGREPIDALRLLSVGVKRLSPTGDSSDDQVVPGAKRRVRARQPRALVVVVRGVEQGVRGPAGGEHAGRPRSWTSGCQYARGPAANDAEELASRPLAMHEMRARWGTFRRC